MILEVDRNIYSDSCISKVVYWFSNQYTIERQLKDNVEYLTIEGVEMSLFSKSYSLRS